MIKINEDYFNILIVDDCDTIKIWIKGLENSISKGKCLHLLEEDIANLENILEGDHFANYTFPSNERIYYSKNKIMYVPNAHSKEEKEFIFCNMKKNLENAHIYVGIAQKTRILEQE
jgi:hypothetical protein